MTILTLLLFAGIGYLLGSFPLWHLIFRHRYRAAAATALTAPVAMWITGNSGPLVSLGLAMGVVIFIRHIPSLT